MSGKCVAHLMFMCQAADGLFCFLVGGALNNECDDFELYINASALTHHYLVVNILNKLYCC